VAESGGTPVRRHRRRGRPAAGRGAAAGTDRQLVRERRGMTVSQAGRRWHLSRGGVINIWEYGGETFDFSGGRAIFQGTNGSGKSRALELLAPLCLDGDLRQMGSKGYDTVSMRRLMLDDYAGESTRIGYAWLELARPDDNGRTEFLTCGIGVKASRTSGQI